MNFTLVYEHTRFPISLESNVDLAALFEVFVAEEYAWDGVRDPKIIIDLGAHFGDTTLYYHLKYPNALIYALEPAPESFTRLEANVSEIEKIIPIKLGIAGQDGIVHLNISKSTLGHSLVKRKDSSSTVEIEVSTLSTFFQRFNIVIADLIKFDIEGAEEFLFTQEGPEKYAAAYIGEVHSDLITVSTDQFISLFRDFTVERIDLSDTRFIMKAAKYFLFDFD